MFNLSLTEEELKLVMEKLLPYVNIRNKIQQAVMPQEVPPQQEEVKSE